MQTYFRMGRQPAAYSGSVLINRLIVFPAQRMNLMCADYHLASAVRDFIIR